VLGAIELCGAGEKWGAQTVADEGAVTVGKGFAERGLERRRVGGDGSDVELARELIEEIGLAIGRVTDEQRSLYCPSIRRIPSDEYLTICPC